MISSAANKSTNATKPSTVTMPLRMQLRYPRSFLALLLSGFFIVALPLIAGLVSNAFSIERLSVQSQQAVYNATLATQNARQLSALTLEMERAARFYAVAGDREMVEGYKKSRGTFQTLLAEFMALPLAAIFLCVFLMNACGLDQKGMVILTDPDYRATVIGTNHDGFQVADKIGADPIRKSIGVIRRKKLRAAIPQPQIPRHPLRLVIELKPDHRPVPRQKQHGSKGRFNMVGED